MTNEDRIVKLYEQFDILITMGEYDKAHKVICLIDQVNYQIQVEAESNETKDSE